MWDETESLMGDYGEIDLRWRLPSKAIKLHKFKIRLAV